MFSKWKNKKKKNKKGKDDPEQYTPSKGKTDFFDLDNLEHYSVDELQQICFKFNHEVQRLQQVGLERKNEMALMSQKQKKMQQDIEAFTLFKQHSENLQGEFLSNQIEMLQQQDIELKKKQKQLSELKRILQEGGVGIDQLQNSTPSDEPQNSLVKKELEQVNHQLQQTQAELEDLKQKENQEAQSLRKKEHLIKEYQQKFQELMEEKDELFDKIESLHEGQRSLKNQYQKQKQSLYEQIQSKEHFINVLKDDKTNLERENNSLTSTIDFLSKKKQELEEKLKRIEDERNRDSHPLFERASIDAISMTGGRSHRGGGVLTNRTVGDEELTHDATPRDNNHYQQDNQLVTKLEVLCRELEDRNQEICKDKKIKLVILREGLSELEQQHRSAKEEIAKVKNQKDQLEQEKKNQSKEIVEANNKLKAQETKVSELMTKRKTANEEILKLQALLDKMKGKKQEKKVPHGIAALSPQPPRPPNIYSPPPSINHEHIPFSAPQAIEAESEEGREIMSLPPPITQDRLFMDKMKGNVEILYKELVSFIFEDPKSANSKSGVNSGQKDAVKLERQLTEIIMQMREYLDDHDHQDSVSNYSMVSAKNMRRMTVTSKDSSPRYSMGGKSNFVVGGPPPQIMENKMNRGKIAAAIQSIKNTPSRVFACIRPQHNQIEEAKLQKPYKKAVDRQLPPRPPSAGPILRGAGTRPVQMQKK